MWWEPRKIKGCQITNGRGLTVRIPCLEWPSFTGQNLGDEERKVTDPDLRFEGVNSTLATLSHVLLLLLADQLYEELKNLGYQWLSNILGPLAWNQSVLLQIFSSTAVLKIRKISQYIYLGLQMPAPSKKVGEGKVGTQQGSSRTTQCLLRLWSASDDKDWKKLCTFWLCRKARDENSCLQK